MDRLIEFAYTASISVGEKCVIHVMNGAVMYQIDSVVKACCDFLVQQLDPSNAIGIASFAEQIGCTELHQKAREYIYMNFSQVRRSRLRRNDPTRGVGGVGARRPPRICEIQLTGLCVCVCVGGDPGGVFQPVPLPAGDPHQPR